MIALITVSAAAVAAAPPPNIVIILADDLGYGDLGCQGCTDVPTPHIDSIAAAGVRFTDGHATHSVCSPSRAGLMSGMYQHRFGFEHNSGPERYASPTFGLPRTVPTLAERLKKVGYATGMVGKWHIGFKEGLRPHERGFDSHYGFLSGAHPYLPGRTSSSPLVRNGEPVTDEKEYLTDAFARESVTFIERSKDGPFFLYLAFNAVHAPLEATAAYEARFPNITDPKRRTYAGMLVAMDDAVGRVLATLREHGLEESTLLFFYSDNGGPTWQTTSRNDPLRGFKGQVYEGGHRIPFLVQWKGRIPAGRVHDGLTMAFDITATALVAAGVPLPQDQPLDGVDLMPYLMGEKTGAPHDRLFWRQGEEHAARVDDWKLVQDRVGGPQLFNLAEDLGEEHDLAGEQPEKLAEVQRIYAEWDGRMMPAQWIRQDARNAEPGGKLKPGGAARGGGTGVEGRFQQFDADGDGRLSKEEVPSQEIFEAADQNDDGGVTLQELEEYLRGRRRVQRDR
jgi:arylsulfatase A-like enzyme